MKKIAIIATHVGEIHRGAETFVIELSKYLVEKYAVDIYARGTVKELESNIISVKVEKSLLLKMHEEVYKKNKIYRKICNWLYWCIPDELFQKQFTKTIFETYVEKAKYDLIFINNGAWGAKYANDLRAKQNIPFIFTGHGGRGEGESLTLKVKPDCYVALGKEQEEWAKKYWDKVVLIYNGVDCNKFMYKKCTPEKKKTKLILMVAALTKYKRHRLAIDAVALLEDVSLLALGEGELHDEVNEYGKEKLGKRFELKSVPYEEIGVYYQNADVFTLPSFKETCAISYLEALATGLPVVAPNDSIRREMIGDAGVLCNCENPEEYAEAIKTAVNLQWGDKPRNQALKFDWKQVSMKYQEIIEKVIK